MVGIAMVGDFEVPVSHGYFDRSQNSAGILNHLFEGLIELVAHVEPVRVGDGCDDMQGRRYGGYMVLMLGGVDYFTG